MTYAALDEKKHSHLAIFRHTLYNCSITKFMKLILVSKQLSAARDSFSAQCVMQLPLCTCKSTNTSD